MSASNLYTHKDANVLKTWIFMAMFFVLVIGVGWLVSYYYQSPLILYVAVAFSVFMNISAYWFSDKLVLRLQKAKPVTRAEHFDLWNMTENLSIAAGLPMPKLYIIEDASPNAFATGRDKEHSVVAVTSGLLSILDKTELEGVIAHELSHIGNKDMLLSTVAVVLAGFVTIIADIFLRSGLSGGRSRNGKGGGAIMIIGLIFAILAPIAATLMRLAISRRREFLADATGALLTRYPEGLASALSKISASAEPLRSAHSATAHLFISNPFKSRGTRPGAMMKLFMTHPPVEERIKALVEKE